MATKTCTASRASRHARDEAGALAGRRTDPASSFASKVTAGTRDGRRTDALPPRRMAESDRLPDRRDSVSVDRSARRYHADARMGVTRRRGGSGSVKAKTFARWPIDRA